MGVTPKALLERPTLEQRWVFPREVFDELSGSRQITFNGPANIPFSEFTAYAVLYGFSRQQAIDTWQDLRIIDNLWLNQLAKTKKTT